MKSNMPMSLKLGGIYVLCALCQLSFARTWTNQQGQTLNAEWVRMENGKVVVRNDQGREISLPVNMLSSPDQEFVRKKSLLEFVEKSHTWTLPDGKLLSAILTKIEAEHITVKDETGKLFKIELGGLPQEDRNFVVTQIKRGTVELGTGADAPRINTVTIDDLFLAIKKDDLDKVREYIEKGGAPDVMSAEDKGMSALSFAALNNRIVIARLLLSTGAGIDFLPSMESSSPLMCAAYAGHFEMVKLLLSNGANLNFENQSSGNTVLMDAVCSNNPLIVKLIVQQGADVLQVNKKQGITALQFALRKNAHADIIKLLRAIPITIFSIRKK